MERRPIDMRLSLDHVARGGIPLRAQERLAEEAGPNRRLFTSDLSVNEFLLAKDARCEPISQVMGSCVFHVGQIADYKGETGEIRVISEAHRQARGRAIARIYQEAAFVRADAVIGARLRERMITMGKRGKGGDDGGEVLEFTVVGTAVRAPWMVHPPGQPIVTDLSGQDFWALAQDGYEPCGFLFEFCRYHVWHVTTESVGHGELSAASDAVVKARSIAARNIHRDVPAADEERGDRFDLRIEPRGQAPFNSAQIGIGRGDVVLSREQQRHVDGDTVEDRLLDRRNAMRRARNLDEEVRTRCPSMQASGSAYGVDGVACE